MYAEQTTMKRSPLCHQCGRYLGFFKCAAYPKGIPDVYFRENGECPNYRQAGPRQEPAPLC
jgi:hypothetical protein